MQKIVSGILVVVVFPENLAFTIDVQHIQIRGLNESHNAKTFSNDNFPTKCTDVPSVKSYRIISSISLFTIMSLRRTLICLVSCLFGYLNTLMILFAKLMQLGQNLKSFMFVNVLLKTCILECE